MALYASVESEFSCHSSIPHCLLKTGYNILPHEEFSPHLYACPQRMDTYTLSQPGKSLHILLPEVKEEQITSHCKPNDILINNTEGKIRNV